MKIGKLISINYSQLKVKISSEIRGGSVNLGGHVYYFGNIGSFLKLDNAIHETIICEVVSIFDSDQQENSKYDVESNRELILKPVGTIDKQKAFALGVGIYPSLYSDVSIVTFEDMEIVLHNHQEEYVSPKVHKTFPLGLSKNLINYPIDISINNFFNIHSAVLGNSGSGKSNTIAHIIQKIHDKTNHSPTGSKVLMFDVNGEYSKAFGDEKNTSLNISFFKPNISGEQSVSDSGFKPFILPHFLMTLDEWSAFLLASDATQRPFWDKVLQESYRFYEIGAAKTQEEQTKFINYLRYKVCFLVISVLQQADTDTARITTVAGILGGIRKMILETESIHNVASDVLKDIIDLQKASTINYGNNENKLTNAVESVLKKVNEEQIQDVLDKKLENGAFFDYRFLKTAAELVLLEEDARGNRQIRGYTATMLTRLDYFLFNPDCKFMRDTNGISSLEGFINQLWGANGGSNQLVIIDTSELSPDILETLTSVVSRLLFDERKKLFGEDRRKKPIHIILDEAHRYIKRDYDYLLKENVFEKIAREGRKFSFYLLISSQRPSELSETVLSQCANFIIHRVQNERDMNYIKAILPYYSDDFTNKIKQSIPGEALVFGSCVSMPLHLKIYEASPRPNSDNCNVPEEWFKKSDE